MTQPPLKEPVQLPIYNRQERQRWFGVAVAVAIVAACFCVFVAGRMAITVAQDWRRSPLIVADAVENLQDRTKDEAVEKRGRPIDPLVAEWVQATKELRARPEDEAIKERIRKIDLELRGRYFSHRVSLVQGAYLLAGGLVVLVLAVKALTQWGAIGAGVMTVFGVAEDSRRKTEVVRVAIAGAGCVLIVGMVMWRLAPAPSFMVFEKGVPATTAATAPGGGGPALAEIMANWPSFRGPMCGSATVSEAPTDWDGATGRNIAWKTEVPLEGKGSPIVWGNKVFLSGASEERQEVYCFDAGTGALVWRAVVPGSAKATDVKVWDDTGYAPATMATDGRHVFAMFPTGDMAAFDFAGQKIWSKNLGKPESQYSLAASLAAYRDRVIVQFDQGSDEKSGKSALIAFDGATGRQVWRTRRNLPNSWASPVVIYPDGDIAKAQIVTCGSPLVIGYDAESGRELWSANLLTDDVAASPAFAGGMVFVANDRAFAAAIRIDGCGDVTKSHVVWKAEDGLPDTVSPLATDEIVLLVKGYTLTCYDAKTGKKLWEHKLDESCDASPVLVGKTIYLVNTNGVTYMFEAGPVYKELKKAALDEKVMATPAIVRTSEEGGGVRIFIRGKTHLYSIKGEEREGGGGR
ncbi:MAG: PQQ-like beta-propeller repeat protein [Phycisphaerales bacterium]|nr:PQQ-like beta-propeller repeat protein [Phycisphaerales bacterium]